MVKNWKNQLVKELINSDKLISVMIFWYFTWLFVWNNLFLSSSPSYRHCCRHHRYHHNHHHCHFCGNQKLKPAFNNDVLFVSSVWRLGGPVLWQEHQYTGASYQTKYDPPHLFCKQPMPLITLLLWDSLPTE